MNVKERVQLLEKQKQERKEAEQSSKAVKSTQITQSTQINQALQNQHQIQNQPEQQDNIKVNRDTIAVINTLNKMFNNILKENDQKEEQLQNQNPTQTVNIKDSDEELEKYEEIQVNDLISQQDEKELQSEERIYVSLINNEFTTHIQNSQRQSMNLQSLNFNDRSQSILQQKLIFNKLNQLILVQDDQVYLENIEKILFIQRFVKQKLEKEKKERVQKEQELIEKNNRYRINIINELIQTEIKYVADLEILNLIKNLSIEKFPNKKDEIKMMFQIDNILKFNTEFLNELQQNKNLKDVNAIVMKSIVPLLNGFIFYYEYCKAYESIRKITSQYEVMPVYQQFLQEIKISNLLKGLRLNDYTIKPVQRLPKYVLLFKDLLKHTMQTHPDYENVKYCLETIEKINDKNNYEMGVFLNQAKLIELYQQFGNIQNLSIFKPNLFFIFEDICSIYTKKIEQRIIYAFNNLLLFAKKKKQNVLKYKLHIPITQQSYIKNIKDLQNLKNSFEFGTRTESIIIINGDKETKQKFMTKIQNIIDQQKELFRSKIDQQQKTNYSVYVEIMGTENNPKQNKNVTFYKIKFTIDTISIESRIRFNQVKSLLQIVNKYDNKLKIQTIIKILLAKNQQAIDERRLRIEQLLQIILNSQQIIENNEYQKQVLEILRIDSKFYSLPEQKRLKPEQFQSMSKFKEKEISSYLNLLQEIQSQTFNLKINKDDQQVKIGNEAQQQPYCIEIILLSGQNLQVGFQKNTLTWFIKSAIANYINLKYFVDFKIFIEDTGGIIRVIEDDEKISTILDKSKQGFLSALKKMFNNGIKFQFMFRKYLYLPQKQEELEYRQDEIRMKYLMFEIVFQAKNKIFLLGFLDFCMMTAFYSIATQQKIDKHLLKKAIPSSIIKQHPEKLWLEQIQKVVAFREKQLQEFQIQSQQKQPNQKSSTIQNLSCLSMITYFQNQILYGMWLFFVECSKETIQIFQQKEFNIKLSPHILIGLNYNGMHLIKPENRTLLVRIDYSLISNVKSFPIEITCKVKNFNVNLKTQTPYEIKHLILEYQELIKVLNS